MSERRCGLAVGGCGGTSAAVRYSRVVSRASSSSRPNKRACTMGLGCFNPPAPTDSRIDWLFDCNYCPPVQAVRETAGVAYRTRGGAPLAYRGLAEATAGTRSSSRAIGHCTYSAIKSEASMTKTVKNVLHVHDVYDNGDSSNDRCNASRTSFAAALSASR